MRKIEILKINNPFEFWISELDSESFINLFDNEINTEYETYSKSTMESDAINNFKDLKESSLIGVYQMQNKKWYRAKVLDFGDSFGKNQYVFCYLIDIGETLTLPKSNCKILRNAKLQKYPPLARVCSLFGIKPASRYKCH